MLSRPRYFRLFLTLLSMVVVFAPSLSAQRDTHRVRRGETLSGIARKYGVSTTALAATNNLNARGVLRAGATLTIPAAGSSQSVRQEPVRYRVRRGDTLSGIARRYGVSTTALAATNNLNARGVLRAGATLTIPAAGSSQSVRQEPVRYRVRRGDTLSGIARRYGVSTTALAATNNLNARGVLRAGATLTIPAGGFSRPVRQEPVRYRVRRGDTLSGIAQRFRVRMAELRRWNGLTSSRILAGQRLSIYATGVSARSTRVRVPVFADSTKDDIADYDDPLVREAAVSALGRYNGSVVAMDPNTGRVLTIVNQKLAFSSGFIPCSTIKPVIALAALEEGVIERDTMVKVAPRRYLNLVEAMARSNNSFFEELGRRMGFDTVSRYARLLGLGELTGYGIAEEQPGGFPSEPPKKGGVARMSSFGEGIQMTPLQLASLVSTLANGGTIYYLQYPRTEEEVINFVPRIKRRLDITALLPGIRDGMLAAVLYGTARRSYEGEGEQPLGKTGTCSESGSRLGWFVSYADRAHPKIVVAVLMRGSSNRVNGASAARVGGRFYNRLYQEDYFADYPNRSEPPPSAELAIPEISAVPESNDGG